jgi:hypothetical protein
MTAMWYGDILAPTWATVLGALNGIVTDLATPVAKSGAERIGFATTALPHASLGFYNVPASPPAPPPGGDSLFNVVSAIIGLANYKASLDKGATFETDEETITGRWRFNNHVRMGINSAVLRAVPADSHYHLVYRSGGKSEVDSTVDWDTYSVYERCDTGSSSDYIEVWGGYLSSDSHVTAPNAGTGAVFVSVGSIQCWMCRIIVTASQVLDMSSSSDWDYFQTIGFLPYVDEFGNPDLLFGQVDVGNDYVPGVTFHGVKLWEADQIVFGGIDLVEKAARIKICAEPYSKVLEGMYAQPGDINDTTGDWIHNSIVISPGRALVDGVPIIYPRTTINNLSSRLLPGTAALPVNDAGLAVPRWYYVWLRKDGVIRIGDHTPVSDWEGSAAAGMTLYRPAASQVESPTYSQKDYTLLDVIYLMHVITGGGSTYYMFDCAPPVGGGERRFLFRQVMDEAPGTYFSHEVRHVTSRDVAPSYDQLYNKVFAAPPYRRSPGIPYGVSCKAVLGYTISFTAPPGEDRSLMIGLNNSPAAAQNGLYPHSFVSGFLSYPFFQRKIDAPSFNPGTGDASLGSTNLSDAGRVDILTRATGGGIGNNTIWSYVSGANDSGIDVFLFLLGFYWDRGAGSQEI